ncbi:uncharacterized protein LOC141696951 [Apium graveolens]|uniref:uncharacterized protein LOC141696951 n=1 Tax=Apium graveolens TaxID=4045 RepID=UPI003D79D7C5
MEALDTYDNARLPVAAPASRVIAGDPNQRQRFYVELVPGETTVVSWKELVREANNETVSIDSSDKNSVQRDNKEVVAVGSSDKAVVQEPSNALVSADSPEKDPEEYIQVVKSRIEESCSIVSEIKCNTSTSSLLGSWTKTLSEESTATTSLDPLGPKPCPKNQQIPLHCRPLGPILFTKLQ